MKGIGAEANCVFEKLWNTEYPFAREGNSRIQGARPCPGEQSVKSLELDGVEMLMEECEELNEHTNIVKTQHLAELNKNDEFGKNKFEMVSTTRMFNESGHFISGQTFRSLNDNVGTRGIDANNVSVNRRVGDDGYQIIYTRHPYGSYSTTEEAEKHFDIREGDGEYERIVKDYDKRGQIKTMAMFDEEIDEKSGIVSQFVDVMDFEKKKFVILSKQGDAEPTVINVQSLTPEFVESFRENYNFNTDVEEVLENTSGSVFTPGSPASQSYKCDD